MGEGLKRAKSAAKATRKPAIVEDRSDMVLVKQADLVALIDVFETASEGVWPRVRAWLENDYGMTEQELDARCRRLGDAVHRDFGIL